MRDVNLNVFLLLLDSEKVSDRVQNKILIDILLSSEVNNDIRIAQFLLPSKSSAHIRIGVLQDYILFPLFFKNYSEHFREALEYIQRGLVANLRCANVDSTG